MRIVIATGGTGGHIIPALQTAAILRQKGHELFLIGSFGSWSERIKAEDFSAKELHAVGLTFRSFSDLYGSVVAMIIAIRHSLNALKKFSPDVVVGFGGYGGFPAVMAGRFLRYPTVIHEQNVVPGRANRFLARWTDRIAVSFEESRKYFDRDKVVRTGCPCNFDPHLRVDRIEAIKRFNFDVQAKTILILGGSQGSHRINLAAIELIKELSLQQKVQVIHISGKTDYTDVCSSYKTIGVPFKVYDFCDEMPVILQLADVAVARAGALTVMETALAGIPTVFIPYPYAGGHQKENALALVKVGAGRMIEENELSAVNLKKEVLDLLDGPQRADLKEKLKTIAIDDAAERLSREIIGIKQ